MLTGLLTSGYVVAAVMGQNTARHSAFEGMLWFAVVVVAVMVLAVLMTTFRRFARSSASMAVPVFTLSELRDLHRRGQVSDAEFEALKDKLVGEAMTAAGPLPVAEAGSEGSGVMRLSGEISPDNLSGPPDSDDMNAKIE
ncbi:MAG: hypothetical protein ACYTHJ_04740 [Planctomycetota bacterium]|jgi:hypothetical protein